ncbi:hypothetical protein PTSG_10603 [Salpingoeca rosetta]|uniref:Uncharacterized protein n=1 Tax=Salpingoeca rosetta (strain ATCC 50818 / BSB-021) TaxID=946362 RepID=F2URU5_SALR5|nr:uncharacterized protein PTSG_10603 [Salpingoeca rosetta]EGD80350.1 hypothetical protein PTSG_10603 [Salpingoeca rosetta]|eukprot:XP_004988140.1 hypothetical protein PTSG_10603 [Salpingoeca rosetta]
MTSVSLTAGVGTPLYMAPEALTGDKYSFEADVFSFGVLMWEVATQRVPDLIEQELGAEYTGPILATLSGLMADGKRLKFEDGGDEGGQKEGDFLRPAALTDQNATLREVNKKYQRQIEELSAEVDALKSELASSQATIASLRDSKEALADAVAAAKKDADTTHMQCTQKLAAAEQDMAAERKTYDESRSSLNAMMDALQKQLDTERELREEVENDRAFSKQQQQEAEEKAKEAEQQMAAQEETVVHLRKQLKEVKGLNLKMLTNLQELQGQVKDEQNKCHAIQQEKDKKAAEIQTLQSKLRDAVARRDHMEAALTEVGTRLKAADGKRVEMETALTVERQWRQSLQQEADRAAEKLEEMEMVRSQLVSTQDELRSLQTKHDMLQQSYRDQEKALLEMGERLSETALQVDRFEAQEKRNRQKQWADDSEIKHCQACERSFGVKRRKHHCRGCGGIFCDECSDNRMPLPSYAKPVRVCDTCEKDIIAKMTAPH